MNERMKGRKVGLDRQQRTDGKRKEGQRERGQVSEVSDSMILSSLLVDSRVPSTKYLLGCVCIYIYIYVFPMSNWYGMMGETIG